MDSRFWLGRSDIARHEATKVTLSALALLTATQQPEISYVARYYKQGKAKSVYQAYTIRLDGTRRRLMSKRDTPVEGAFWADRNHLVILEVADLKFIKKPEWTERLFTLKAMLVNVQSGDRKLLRTIKGVSDVDYDGEGDAFLVSFENAPSQSFRVVKGGITRDKGKPIPNPFDVKYTPGQNLVPMKYSLATKQGAQQYSWVVDDRYTDTDTVAITREIQGKSSMFPVLGSIVRHIWRGSDGATYIQSEASFRHESFCYVYRWEDKSPVPKKIISDVGHLEFDPAKKYWLGRNSFNLLLGGLDDGRGVYVSEVILGNWRTGRRWTPVKGLVAVAFQSPRMRPDK